MGLLVNGTPRYPDKMLFCPDNKCPVNEDWIPVNEDWSLVNEDYPSPRYPDRYCFVRLTGVRITGTKFCRDNKCPINEFPNNKDRVYCSDILKYFQTRFQ